MAELVKRLFEKVSKETQLKYESAGTISISTGDCVVTNNFGRRKMFRSQTIKKLCPIAVSMIQAGKL